MVLPLPRSGLSECQFFSPRVVSDVLDRQYVKTLLLGSHFFTYSGGGGVQGLIDAVNLIMETGFAVTAL